EERNALALAHVEATELLGRERVDTRVARTVSHARERRIVQHDDLAAAVEPDVELDALRSFGAGALEGEQGVFGRCVASAAMPEHDRRLSRVAKETPPNARTGRHRRAPSRPA